MLRVGIVGYGNLGQAVERSIYRHGEYKLIKIFSRREVKSPYGTEVERLDNISKYMGKIDIMILCVGSYEDIESIGPKLIKKFNTIDTFDTHSKIVEYKERLNKLATECHRTAIISCGWDPGLMSLVRTLFDSIGDGESVSFWGKGVSQGHSNAIRLVDGVANAIQYTIPYKSAVRRARAGMKVGDKHKRLCYVAIKTGYSKRDIRDKIMGMDNYFKGYKTIVKFVSQDNVARMQKKLYHRGYVVKSWDIAGLYHTTMSLRLDIESNPDFTAEIVMIYLRVVDRLYNDGSYGVYDVLDIPFKMLLRDKNKINI